MEFVKKSIGKWIEAAIILVVGILCIVAGAQLGGENLSDLSAASDTMTTISYVLGYTFIVLGALGLIGAIIAVFVAKRSLAEAATASGVTLAAGIWLVVKTEAATLISLLISYVPYVMIVVGAVMALDVLFVLFQAIKEKTVKSAIAAIVIGCLVAVASIVIGSLCVADVIPGNVQLIVFGIILVVYAAFVTLATFIALPVDVTAANENVAVVVTEKAPAEEKAEEDHKA